MKRIFFTLLLLVAGVTALFAVKAYPYLITSVQPDGTIISYYLYGDENFSYATSEDGLLIKCNPQGVYEYAYVKDHRSIETTGVKAYNIEERSANESLYVSTLASAADMIGELKVAEARARMSAPVVQSQQKAYPLSGSPKSLVILANFSDVKFKVSNPQKEFTDLLNQEGYSKYGATGSARDYFKEASFGQFSPEFVVVGPYDLPKTQKYYGEQTDANTHDANARQMVIDACVAAADDPNVNLSDYDTDKDGVLDNVFIYYAGHNQAEGGGEHTIWPHRSVVAGNYQPDGVLLRDYACTSEYRGSNGTMMAGIGTFCHEFGHVLSLADLYNTANEASNHNTMGSWDIMDNGSYNNNGMTPPAYSAFERFYLGWLKPEVLTEGSHLIEPLVESNTAYLVSATGTHNLSGKSPNPNEYFLIENRQPIGFDTYAPGHGMLVTHIVYTAAAWDKNIPNDDPDNMGVEIVCAYGTTSSPAANTYPGTSNVTTCYFTLRNGTRLPLSLNGIREDEQTVAFTYGEGNIVLKSEYRDFKAYYRETTDIQQFVFEGKNVESDVEFKVKSRHYKIRRYEENSGEPYMSSLVVSPDSDGNLNVVVDVKFDPQSESHSEPLKDRLMVSATDCELEYVLTGYSLRPVKVTPPVAYDAKNVTPSSFTASWSEVEDAVLYYVSAYTIRNEASSQVEEFSTFDTKAPKGWTANFNKVNTSYKLSAPHSIEFSQLTDTLITKEYFMEADKIKVWAKAQKAKGTLCIDALIDGKWENVMSQDIKLTDRDPLYEVSLSGKSARQFRIYAKVSNGSILLDDFTVDFSRTIEYLNAAEGDYEFETDQTSFTFNNLRSSTTYRYSVKASDRDPKGRYENITAPSNVIEVTTPVGVGVENVEAEQNPGIQKVMENGVVYILRDGEKYTISGKQVK